MALKLFRAVWFLSALLVLVNLLYVYASLPETVILQQTDELALSREWFFYVALLGIVVVNVLVYLLKMLNHEAEDLRAWFHGLTITINIFIIVSLHALNVYNNNEMFDHNRVTFVIGGSIGLILLWAALWPLYLVFQKKIVKQAV